MKLLKGILVLLLTLILWLLVRQYLLCPQLIFTEGRPFSGSNLYNPYENLDSSRWMRCNFHAHSKAWLGITNGKGTPEDIWNAYEMLGYDVHCVSNYHEIIANHNGQSNYVSAYEHGYNLLKTHQLVLGDTQVVGLDYFFPQTRSNKQDLLNRLSANRNNMVIVNHPTVRDGYQKEDFSFLSNYHCMEIASPYQTSYAYWDQALSAGKPIFAVANDDIHNIFDKRGIGRFFTCVNAPETSQEAILGAFKKGCHYTVVVSDKKEESDAARSVRLTNIKPFLKSFLVSGDSIKVSFNQICKEIRFIGQNGKLLSTSLQTNFANYAIGEGDNYVRVETTFEDGTLLFLNPVFRYSDEKPLERNFKENFSESALTTFALQSLGYLILIMWLYQIYILWFRNSR